MPLTTFRFKLTDETERTYFEYILSRTAWQARLDSDAIAGVFFSEDLDALRVEMLDKFRLWQTACERSKIG